MGKSDIRSFCSSFINAWSAQMKSHCRSKQSFKECFRVWIEILFLIQSISLTYKDLNVNIFLLCGSHETHGPYVELAWCAPFSSCILFWPDIGDVIILGYVLWNGKSKSIICLTLYRNFWVSYVIVTLCVRSQMTSRT